MRPLTLEEFAQQLRLEGNQFADEILVLCTLERDVADPHYELCGDLDHYVPEMAGKPARQLERLGDRAALLTDIEDKLRQAGHDGDADDVIEKLLRDLAEAQDVLAENGLREYDL